MEKYPLSWTTPHSHVWFDPTEPPIQRGAYSPIIGEGRRQMKPGHTYRCWRCGAELTIPERFRKVAT